MNADQERREGHDAAEPDDAASAETNVARGRSPATPFVLLGSVAAVVWAAVAIVSLAALLIWWLV